MLTEWGKSLDREHPLPEYPRPQLVRESYLNLNGRWQYAITSSDTPPERWDGFIIVPFSPETSLSGVERSLSPREYLWYRRPLTLPEGFNVGRVLLHFGAVDQEATVYLDGREVCSHVGGYLPFDADISDALAAENELVVRVRDLSDKSFHTRGKQKTKRGGIWYTPQSGIWQTVWCESVPESHIKNLRLTPQLDEGAVDVFVEGEGEVTARIGEDEYAFPAGVTARLKLSDTRPWSPEEPYLHDISLNLGDDCVTSYFALRKFSVGTDKLGVKRLFLNNEPYFHNGLLDQGYWPDGLYTAPSDAALIFDIRTAKDMGFNLLRKHIKVEPLRWYYHCDRLGMLVWQDMPCGGGRYSPLTVSTPLFTGAHMKDSAYGRFGRSDAEGREEFTAELRELVAHLYNCPCIAMWVPFNEGWGQFDAAENVAAILELDDSRTIDHASGWHDQGIGEIKSLHVYFDEYAYKPDKLGRCVVLSEFGGYSHAVAGHAYSEKPFGYKKFSSPESLRQGLMELYDGQIRPAVKAGLAACVYTQLSDVEDEQNGLITYDRAVIKLPPAAVNSLSRLKLI
ncbi:MAG: glycoside hydrolase family 2 TIM barrel-domain containing protein [Oscillospiraceae bacterium]